MTRLTDSRRDPLLWGCHYFRWKSMLDRVGVHSIQDENPSHNHHGPTRHNPDTHPSQGTLWLSGGSYVL